ncbi:uncharacterized protein MYCGRDRAFT_97203 [Zymoseptoria tritici IPO323]|uniref:Uncharacterized protein n=1 Tax=Zymoseptoria tritici (strain CBS 115943 / IPO323) TaxID=336722 RepID=F9XP77_ZYMTI|nr:uncharacterized protein MYCGRDRAFT_97203 [Zymoseptoria tritici IPO323]EGP83043.1 hypothetical protein MYCGRDRAFT_97203 [Zymoseptoria tritici IPO323]
MHLHLLLAVFAVLLTSCSACGFICICLSEHGQHDCYNPVNRTRLRRLLPRSQLRRDGPGWTRRGSRLRKYHINVHQVSVLPVVLDVLLSLRRFADAFLVGTTGIGAMYVDECLILCPPWKRDMRLEVQRLRGPFEAHVMILLQQVLRGSRTLQHNLASRRCTLSFLPRASFAPSPITHMQASPILTVCHLEDDAPCWSASRRRYLLTESTDDKHPTYKNTDGNWRLGDKDLDQLTFLFLMHGHNTRMIWTFEFPKYTGNLLHQLYHAPYYGTLKENFYLWAVLSEYLYSLIAFNRTAPRMEASPHYVRYGFHRLQGAPLLADVELSTSAEKLEPSASEYDLPIEKEGLVRRRERRINYENHLIFLRAFPGACDPADLVHFAELDDEKKQRELEFEKVAYLVRRRLASQELLITTWTNDEIRTLLSIVKQGQSSKDIAKSLSKSTNSIEAALRRLSGLPLVLDHGAVISPDVEKHSTHRALGRLVRARTTAWWSDEEVNGLVDMCKRHWSLETMAKRINMPETDVAEALQKLGMVPTPELKYVWSGYTGPPKKKKWKLGKKESDDR